MKSRKIKERLYATIILFSTLILGSCIYRWSNQIETDFLTIARLDRVLCCFVVIFGVVVWGIVISIGKPLSEISSEKKKIITGILIFMFLMILLLAGIEMYFLFKATLENTIV